MVQRLFALGGVACVLAGCFTSSIDGVGGPTDDRPAPECVGAEDCAHLDTDDDPCTAALCVSGKCQRELIKNTGECQCHGDADCTYFEGDCTSGTCDVGTHVSSAQSGSRDVYTDDIKVMSVRAGLRAYSNNA